MNVHDSIWEDLKEVRRLFDEGAFSGETRRVVDVLLKVIKCNDDALAEFKGFEVYTTSEWRMALMPVVMGFMLNHSLKGVSYERVHASTVKLLCEHALDHVDVMLSVIKSRSQVV
jgi:hypothetical protein